jgi:hypothetical protein
VPTNAENAARIHSVSNHVMELQKLAAVQVERDRELRELVTDLRKDLEKVIEGVERINSMANRWKGGFIVLTAIGGLIGWVVASWNNIVDIVRGTTP